MTTPSTELFSTKMLPLPAITNFLCVVLAYKIKNSLIKNNVDIKLIKDIHHRNTRNREDFYVSGYVTKFGESDFFYRGLIKYNSLDDRTKNQKELHEFKKLVSEYFFNLYIRQG